MVKKEKINYSCLCGMNFGNKKDNYNRHINKINPCIGVAPKIPRMTPNLPQNFSLCVEIKQNDEENKPKKQETNNKFCCPHCNKNFVKKYGLNRHLDGRCKFKPNETKTAQNETKSEQENNNDDKLNYIIEQLNELNTDKVEPLTSILNQSLRSRKDEISDGKIREKILQNSPKKNEEFFVVPKVVE